MPHLDYIRVFVGKASAVGIPLARLPMPAGPDCTPSRTQRAKSETLAHSLVDLELCGEFVRPALSPAVP